MKRRIASILTALYLIAGMCGCSTSPDNQDNTLTVAATTYPVYLLASAVAEGVDGIEVTAVVNQAVSCVHDYTLTIRDMKIIEQADCILLSGAGLEDFMEDAIGDRTAIDCSEGITLLCADEGHNHDHESADEDDHHDHNHDHGEFDPHIWMSPENAALMTENIAAALAELDPDHSEVYLVQGERQAELLREFSHWCHEELEELSCRDLITFHEGFGYLAESCHLHILSAIEEEAGSEASAQKIVELVELIDTHNIPVIFVEQDGSDATALAIQRECGVEVASLSMLMNGEDYSSKHNYISLMTKNIETIKEVLG